MYGNLAGILAQYTSLLLPNIYNNGYNGNNLGSVPLLQLAGKIVVIVDKLNEAYAENPAFYEYVNMVSNSFFMRSIPYYDIAYAPDVNELIDFNKTCMTIGTPDNGNNPPNPKSTVMRECGVQMLAMRYQLSDATLQENEDFFDLAGYAFVLKPERLRANASEVSIKAPPAQDPSLSYAARTITGQGYSFTI